MLPACQYKGGETSLVHLHRTARSRTATVLSNLTHHHHHQSSSIINHHHQSSSSLIIINIININHYYITIISNYYHDHQSLSGKPAVSSRQMATFRQEAPYRTLTVSTSAWQRPSTTGLRTDDPRGIEASWGKNNRNKPKQRESLGISPHKLVSFCCFKSPRDWNLTKKNGNGSCDMVNTCLLNQKWGCKIS